MSKITKAVGRWNDYWFRPAPYLDLAIFRIVACSTQLIFLWRARDWHVVRSGLEDSFWSPIVVMNIIHLPWGWSFRPPIEVVEIAYVTAAVAGVLGLLGLFTNISLAVLTIASIYFQAFIFSFGDYHHRQAVVMVALASLALSPSGRVLSVDFLLRRQVSEAGGSCSSFAGWPLKLTGWFFVLMYLSAVWGKLFYGGVEWPNGFTLQYYMARDGMLNNRPLGIWLSHYHYLVLLLQFGVLLFQATFCVAMIVPRSRWIYVPWGLMLHLGIYIAMGPPFFQWIALYVVFVPWSSVLSSLKVWRSDYAQRGARSEVVGPI